MHLQYVALVAAAALVAGTHGHEAAPVEGNANRFLTSNDKDLAKVSTGHASLLLQEGGAGRHLLSGDDDGGPTDDDFNENEGNNGNTYIDGPDHRM